MIRYTLDGGEPSLENGTTYEGPILINSSATLKARAFRDDWRPSEIYGAIYTIIGNIANPVFTPGAGTYTSPVDVYISVNPPDATIYYTTDGSEPSQSNGTVRQAQPVSRPAGRTTEVQMEAKRKAYFAPAATLGVAGETAKETVKGMFGLEHFADATLEQLRTALGEMKERAAA